MGRVGCKGSEMHSEMWKGRGSQLRGRRGMEVGDGEQGTSPSPLAIPGVLLLKRLFAEKRSPSPSSELSNPSSPHPTI